ncbi:hypothetical protein [Streptomyces amritsarensis]|uniref:hypothetical protein n=1 Tax=Streptomyces amritsarensis TaxID=681158 RepID=UPI00142D8721|nr:hypothetical protein [Streptomyces amritsarensis]
MGGMKDKRQEPAKSREEQQRPRRPGLDPVHPEPRRPSRGPGREVEPSEEGLRGETV